MRVESIINYYGVTQKNKWAYYPAFSSKLNKSALDFINSKDFLIEKVSKNKYIIGKYIINILLKACNCRFFLKKAICRHSLAYTHQNQLNWFGPLYSQRNEFIFKNKKGRKRGFRYKKSKHALEFDSD